MAATFIESYIRVDDRFVSIKDFRDELPDKLYVDGAIVCRIDGRDILTFDHWDLVDQLWCYIAEGLGKLANGENADVGFPDQPLRFRFEPISRRCVRITIGDESANYDLSTFLFTMQRGAKEFFAKMKELHPSASDTWDRYEKEVDALVT